MNSILHVIIACYAWMILAICTAAVAAVMVIIAVLVYESITGKRVEDNPNILPWMNENEEEL